MYELPNGTRFSLLVNGDWDFGDNVPKEVKTIIKLTPAHDYEHPVTHDLTDYIAIIAQLTNAKVIGELRADPAPPDAIF